MVDKKDGMWIVRTSPRNNVMFDPANTTHKQRKKKKLSEKWDEITVISYVIAGNGPHVVAHMRAAHYIVCKHHISGAINVEHTAMCTKEPDNISLLNTHSSSFRGSSHDYTLHSCPLLALDFIIFRLAERLSEI